MGIATGGKRSILHIQECCRFHYESDGKKESERIMRILIAEDNPVNQKLIELICRRKGYDTLIVPNGEAAVEAVSSGGFGLVLMDIMMPRMDGIEATRRIRSLPAPLGDTPIYAITAFVSEENRTNCHAVGMNGFLTKPFRPADLVQIIASVLGSPDILALPGERPGAAS
jgi:CheY-like chemotaxis protein